jgi:hypothetical protein
MDKPVKLEDIIDGIEMQTDESSSYLNIKTGEVVIISDEESSAAEEDKPIDSFPEWQHELINKAKEILRSNDYISLPSKFQVHEYRIMEKFCLSITDDQIRDILYYSIKGSGAFQRFKDNIYKYNLEEGWYKFRDEAIKRIAIEWCEDNGINYIEE